MNSIRSAFQSKTESKHVERTALKQQAKLLGYFGLLPFISLATVFSVTHSDLQQQSGNALVAYGAVIISFLGANHWTLAVNGIGKNTILFGIIPGLIGWLAILLPLQYGMFTIIFGLLLTYVADSRWNVMHAWYLVLRKRLTLIATLSVTIAFISSLWSI